MYKNKIIDNIINEEINKFLFFENIDEESYDLPYGDDDISDDMGDIDADNNPKQSIWKRTKNKISNFFKRPNYDEEEDYEPPVAEPEDTESDYFDWDDTETEESETDNAQDNDGIDNWYGNGETHQNNSQQQRSLNRNQLNINDFLNMNENNPISNALYRLAQQNYIDQERALHIIREIKKQGW